MPQVHYYEDGLAPIGRNGQFYDATYWKDTLTLINADPQAQQVSTVTVTGATNGKAYTMSVNGVPVSYQASTTATTQEIAAGLADAVNSDPALSGVVFALPNAATFTLTSRIYGTEGAFTATSGDAQLSISLTVTAANAAPVPFGRCMVRTSDRMGRLVKASDFGGAEARITFTVQNDSDYVVNLIVDGSTYTATYTSDSSATAGEIVGAMVTAINGFNVGITASNETGVLLLIGGPGVDFQVGALTLGTVTDFGAGRNPDDVFVALLTDSIDGYQMAFGGLNGIGGYPPNSSCNGMRRGRAIVEVEGSVSIGDDVYVRVAANGSLDKIGAFSNVGGAGLIKLSGRYHIAWHMPISSSQAVIQLG